MMDPDLRQFLIQFHDHLAPQLDTYEQAVYLYVFRRTRLEGKPEEAIGFKSARARMACGIGEKGRPMSESTAYLKLQSLERKGCIEILSSEHAGRRIRLRLPNEIPGVIPDRPVELAASIEDLDFFTVQENRQRIIEREEGKCFYCLRTLSQETHVIEHVVSRPEGNNSYRNVVAACRQCNNRKGASSAADYFRTLYREGLLNSEEIQTRLSQLDCLLAGQLVPVTTAIITPPQE